MSSLGGSPLWTPPAVKVSCAKELLSTPYLELFFLSPQVSVKHQKAAAVLQHKNRGCLHYNAL